MDVDADVDRDRGRDGEAGGEVPVAGWMIDDVCLKG